MLTFAGTYVMKLMLRWGWGWGGVGWWGMLTFAGTYVMKLMLKLWIRTLAALVEAKVTGRSGSSIFT